ncbi:hypothetical protein [Streptomyces hygroscopicus]|uniref:hypothetical protein n=1 Tax=Streptomyces hygroscopicus TaxID=1912 RepID=UPI0037AABB11
MIALARAQLAQRERRKADEAIQKLREDVAALGIGPVPGPVRVALRYRHQTKAKTRAFYIAFCCAFLTLSPIPEFAKYLERGDQLAKGIPHYDTSKVAFGNIFGDFRPGGIAFFLLLPLIWHILCSAARSCGALSHTFEPVDVWVDLIGNCADVVRTSATHGKYLKAVSIRLPVLRVRGARVSRGTIRLTSQRNKLTRVHGRQVVAALRAAESQLDADPRKGAHELARLTLKISERYALGRVGALLDDSDLKTPRRWDEMLRLSVAATLVALIAVVAPSIGIPQPFAIAAAVVGTAVLFRSATAGGFAVAGLAVIEILMTTFFPGK